MVDIQQYIDFFEFSKKLGAEGVSVVAKTIIIANIMANFCALSIFSLICLASIACRPLPVIKRKSGANSRHGDDVSIEETHHRSLLGNTSQLPPALRCRIQGVQTIASTSIMEFVPGPSEKGTGYGKCCGK